MDKVRWRVLVGCVAVIFLAVMWSSDPYRDLASRYGATAAFVGTPISAATMVVVGQEFDGAANYRGVMAVSLPPGAIEMQGRGITGWFLRPVRIPREAVRFCAKTCFGRTSWDERVPVLPSNAETAWLYDHSHLPEPRDFEGQFAARATFDEALHRSCIGT